MTVDPSKLRIVTYPHEALRCKADPIESVTDEVRAVARRMIELMHDAAGIGLAAPQVAVPWRMFVCFVPENEHNDPRSIPASASLEPRAFINPVLSDPEGGTVVFEEGCLSLPNIHGDVLRPPTITISAIDLDGKPFSQTGTGLLARCWQHEYDHLDGVLILDRFTQMSRLKNRSAIRQMVKDAR